MNTRILFLEELNRIRHDILAMASRVDENVGNAWEALRNNDQDLAQEVRSADALVNAMQLKIEDQAAVLIATQQPVARDLRELVTIFKITLNLERAGDHAVHLAKVALELSGEPSFRVMEDLEKMTETGRDMIRSALSAYLSQDSAAARQTAALDDQIDNDHKIITQGLLHLMQEHPELINQAVHILRTSGFLERLGDHVTNICEGIVYMVENKHEEL
ncbi:MAG: phosphate signaling complex protein PhoU [Spirochaetaceae bacterium]|jgi:phosphate transport system protein|nr:phosphate signaling complex protein PhoU [Spirochaetaceae bacterium]